MTPRHLSTTFPRSAFRMAGLAAILALAGCRGGPPADELAASGTIEARQVEVAARVGGQVREVRIEEGARVAAGDVLAVLDHENMDIQLRQAEAGIALAEAQLALLRQGARSEDIRQAEAALAQTETALTVAGADARRMRELESRGGATRKQREDAEARLAATQSQVTAAREALKKVRASVRPEEIRAAEARLAQAQAAADLLRKAVSDSTIASPGPGVVTVRAVEPGETVAPGATVAVITDLDRVHVTIYVPAGALGRVRLGDPAEVRIDSLPGRVFAGTVTFISPEAEFTPKNVQTREDRVKLVFGVKIEVPNPEHLLKPGLPADAVVRPAALPDRGE